MTYQPEEEVLTELRQREAERFAKRGYWPARILLKLYDEGPKTSRAFVTYSAYTTPLPAVYQAAKKLEGFGLIVRGKEWTITTKGEELVEKVTRETLEKAAHPQI